MNKFIACIISLIIVSLSICFILIPDVSFSENENRYLQEFPEFGLDNLIDKKYILKLEDYFNEQFPFRIYFMKFRTMIYRGLKLNYINGVYFADDGYLIAKSKKCYNCSDTINSINNFINNVDNVNINLMIIPNAISIYYDKLPKNVTFFDQIEAINDIYNSVNIDNTINVYNTFIKNKDKYQLYYKTDHHYTLYGAYLAYVEYCEINNLDYKKLEDYKIEIASDNFSGTLESKVVDYRNIYDKIEIVNKDIDVTIHYDGSKKTYNSLYNFEYLNKKNQYPIFLNNNRSLMTINRNGINNNSKLLVVKDSYANSMIPFLVDNYSEIHVIDLRFYNGIPVSNYVNENNIDNVLILYNFNTLTGGSLIKIE